MSQITIPWVNRYPNIAEAIKIKKLFHWFSVREDHSLEIAFWNFANGRVRNRYMNQLAHAIGLRSSRVRNRASILPSTRRHWTWFPDTANPPGDCACGNFKSEWRCPCTAVSRLLFVSRIAHGLRERVVRMFCEFSASLFFLLFTLRVLLLFIEYPVNN